MKIALLGGSGFVGAALARALQARGDEPIIVSLRDPRYAAHAAAQCEAIVNLAGEPIAQRWTRAVKQRIFESRTAAPRAFLEELSTMKGRATRYLSASAIDYYGTSADDAFDESSAAGTTFLANVCVAWEREAHGAQGLGMSVACIRTGLALGNGGILARLLPLFRAGLGGRIADGSAWYSWIHIDDLAGIYLAALDGCEGPLNAVAPNPVTNAAFTRTLAATLHRPAVFAVPTFAIALALGEGACALLDRQRVLPKRALELGYRFRFATLEEALRDLLA